jgi:hypothetical protein
MENTGEQKVTSHITKGIIISLVLIVLDFVGGMAKIKMESWFRWIPTLIFCAAIIWACINYATQMHNYVTFGNVFAHGFKTTAVVTCLMVVYAVLSVYIISPEQKELALEEARKQLEKNNQMSDSDIETALEFTRRMFVPIAIGGTLLGTLIVGAIASLLGAAFAKKTPPSPFQNPS